MGSEDVVAYSCHSDATLILHQGVSAGLGQAHGGCGFWGGDGDVREDLVAGQGGRPVPAA